MASVTYGNVIYGLRDLKVTELDGSPQEDLGAAMTLTVQPQFSGGNLEGDDAIKAVVSFITHAEGDLSAGEVSSAALAIMTGVAIVTTSTSPTEVSTMQIDEGDNMPYFKVYGQSLDEGIGDLQILLAKVKLTSFEAMNLENGSFRVSNATVVAVDDGSNGVIQFVQHETAVAVPSS